MSHLATEKGGAEDAKPKNLSKHIKFRYQYTRHFLTKKMQAHTWCFHS